MSATRTVVFSCQWSPHYCFQSLYRRGVRGEGDAVRIVTACVGRVGEDLVLEAFHQGADAVWVLGCPRELCRHGLADERFAERIAALRGILALLGIPDERFVVRRYHPHEGERFARDFAELQAAGTPRPALSPLAGRNEAGEGLPEALLAIAREGTLRRCYDCGKCTSVCPLNLGGRLYSPRRLGQIALEEPGPALQDALWDCLTCGACKEACPTGVDFPDFVRRARALLPGTAARRECSHGGALQTIQRLTSAETRRQNRLGWIPAGALWARQGETLLFTGSAPYYDRYFDYLAADATAAPRAALRILNRLGLTPVLLEDERSSGHDLLFSGDEEGFRRLAALNFSAMKEAGVRRVVTTCAESYHVLAFHYPRVLPGFSLDVQHFLPFLEREIAGRHLALEPVERTVTYHDPCRLARLSGVIDAPRRLLSLVPGLRLAEMRRSGRRALCCGTSAWLRCGAVNRGIQGERLREAADTGSDTLLSACPKCLIHFRCALAVPQALPQALPLADSPAEDLSGPQGATGSKLRLEDITEVLARAIAPEDGGGTA